MIPFKAFKFQSWSVNEKLSYVNKRQQNERKEVKGLPCSDFQ